MDGRHKRRFRALYGGIPSNKGDGVELCLRGVEKDKDKIDNVTEDKGLKGEKRDVRAKKTLVKSKEKRRKFFTSKDEEVHGGDTLTKRHLL